MGRLIDGEWVTEELGTDAQGRFVRRAATYRARPTADGSSGFPAVPGRYHLYVSHACGWSHRTLLFRQLKGLQAAVSVSFTEPLMLDDGWTLGPQGDPILGKSKLYEVYLASDPGYTGRVTVPVLWDRERGEIVTNESADICAAFDREFDGCAGHPELHLFPADGAQAEAVQAMIDANYDTVNNGVYRAGFAGTQAAHEEAARAVFERLDAIEAILAESRYLCGDTPTAADWFLFPTLFRFDAVYHTHFKCNLRRIVDYPNLWGYTRELYQWPGVREVCDLAQAKQHYYRSHATVNPRGLVPIGPAIDFDAPHGRGG